MTDVLYFVGFSVAPTRYVMSGSAQRSPTWEQDVRMGGADDAAVQVREITAARWRELHATDEPSRVIAQWYGLPYDKRLPAALQGTTANIVELVADNSENGGFDQPCRFGNRVEEHAVYCHNPWWVDAPRKCRRTWYTGGRVRDEDCPGFESREAALRGGPPAAPPPP